MSRDYSIENKARRRHQREEEAKQRAQQRLADSLLPHIPAAYLPPVNCRQLLAACSEVTQLAGEPATKDVEVGIPAASSEGTQLAGESASDDVQVGHALNTQDSTDAALSQHSTSDVTQLAVVDGAAAQPTTSPSSSGMQCPECNTLLCGSDNLDFRIASGLE